MIIPDDNHYLSRAMSLADNELQLAAMLQELDETKAALAHQQAVNMDLAAQLNQCQTSLVDLGRLNDEMWLVLDTIIEFAKREQLRKAA